MTTAVGVQDVVEVDAELDDRESSYGEEISSYSTSVSSSVKAYEWKNGYQFPNDEAKQDWLDMFHHCLVYLAYIGTGTGIWAIEMGDRHPEVEQIVGNDLSPIQPPWVPPNVKFYVDNVEAQWTNEQPYDFIHQSETWRLGGVPRGQRQDALRKRLVEAWVKDAGFINVEHKLYKLPVGTWPKEKVMVLGWSKEEVVTIFNATVLAAALDRKVHGLYN
ncbi:hypothetical protein FQN53_001724 [Emmonsiellopsis sp. PD_33]|nr:hypothetical protein FQN53_001724 [Emmonsiellopsis sp. PD_33]